MESTDVRPAIASRFLFGMSVAVAGGLLLLDSLPQILAASHVTTPWPLILTMTVLLDIITSWSAAFLRLVGAVAWPVAFLLGSGAVVWRSTTSTTRRATAGRETSHVN